MPGSTLRLREPSPTSIFGDGTGTDWNQLLATRPCHVCSLFSYSISAVFQVWFCLPSSRPPNRNANLVRSFLTGPFARSPLDGLIPVYSRRDDSRTNVHPQFSKPIQMSRSYGAHLYPPGPRIWSFAFLPNIIQQKIDLSSFFEVDSSKFFYGRHWRINTKTQSRPGHSVMLCYWLA